MRIKFSNKTMKKALSIFNIEMPFSEKQLKIHFIKLAKENHPDVNSDSFEEANEKMKEILEAYNILKGYASENGDKLSEEDELFLKEFIKDPMKVYETCPICHGEKTITRNRFMKSTICPECHGEVWYYDKCPACKGTGKFQQARSKKIVTCLRCNGYGTKMKKCTNKDCYEGRISIFKNITERCPQCKGTGHIELDLFNAVIKPGAILK